MISEIKSVLNELGVRANYKGYNRTANAIHLALEDEDRLLSVTTEIYAKAGGEGCSWKAVERNIRTASTVAWKRNRALLEALAKRSLDRRLCSAEFLALLLHAVLANGLQKSSNS